jgi:acyl carrier protein
MDERIKAVLSAVFDIPAEEIDDGTGPGNVGMWDSLNHLRMATEIEKAFRIRLAQREIREMTTYARIRETVERHVGRISADR